MEVNKLFAPSNARAQVNSHQSGSDQQTDRAEEQISMIPIRLRTQKQRRMDHIQNEVLATELPDSYPESRCCCVLIVEDDQSLGAVLEEAVVSWGYRVRVARNGHEGLAFLALHSVDAILLDLHMPVMDGRTMLDEIRWAGYTMPVWVMSGGMETQALRRLGHEGAQGFLIKPFGLLALQQALDQMIDQQQ